MSHINEYKKSTNEKNSSFVNLFSSATHSPIDNIRPIGIFWDIENCSVPCGRSAVKLVEKIRQFIIDKGFREKEFLVVCDTHKCPNELIDDLNSSQVTVVHVNSSAKNAADDKLKQQICRFVETHGYQSALLVLTGMSLALKSFQSINLGFAAHYVYC
jgi:meiosis arrest female protein 1